MLTTMLQEPNAHQTKKHSTTHQPWSHVSNWAEKRRAFQTEFCAFLLRTGNQYTLPWCKRGCCAKGMGNTSKIIFMQLKMHDLQKTATVSYFQHEGIIDESQGLLGIREVTVTTEQREHFDNGCIPSADSKRKLPGGHALYKTLVRNWRIAGFEESVFLDGTLRYEYNQETFDRMQAQFGRQDQAKRAKAKATQIVPPPSNATQVIPAPVNFAAVVQSPTQVILPPINPTQVFQPPINGTRTVLPSISTLLPEDGMTMLLNAIKTTEKRKAPEEDHSAEKRRALDTANARAEMAKAQAEAARARAALADAEARAADAELRAALAEVRVAQAEQHLAAGAN